MLSQVSQPPAPLEKTKLQSARVSKTEGSGSSGTSSGALVSWGASGSGSGAFSPHAARESASISASSIAKIRLKAVFIYSYLLKKVISCQL